MATRIPTSWTALIATSLLAVGLCSPALAQVDEDEAKKERQKLQDAWTTDDEGGAKAAFLRLLKAQAEWPRCKDCAAKEHRCSQCGSKSDCSLCTDESCGWCHLKQQHWDKERRWWRLHRQLQRAIVTGDADLEADLRASAEESLRRVKARKRRLVAWYVRKQDIEDDLSAEGEGKAQRKLDRTRLPPARWDHGAEVFTGRASLSGFGAIIDARTTEVVNEALTDWGTIRLDFPFSVRRRQSEFRGRARGERTSLRSNMGLQIGLSHPYVELGLFLRGYERVDLDLDLDGRVSYGDRDEGGGDLELALKVPVPMDAVGISRALRLAIYGTSRVEAGSRTRQPSQGEAGVAISFFPWGSRVEFHTNLAGFAREHGTLALSYRAGVAIASELSGHGDAVVRAHFGASGREYEGRATSDLDLEGGLQLFVNQWLKLQLSGFYRVMDSGFREASYQRSLDRIGYTERHEENRVYGGTFSVGFVF